MSDKLWLSEWAPLLRAMDAGKCPVLISGIGASSRAHAAATLRREMGFPLFIICPDDQSAEIMARDMENLLGEIPLLLPSREINLYPADSVSRGEEQKRLAALFTLSESTPPITVCSAAAPCPWTPSAQPLPPYKTARTSAWKRWKQSSSAAAMSTAFRLKPPANTPAAAAYWTSTPLPTQTPSA